jgi:CDP-glycerol glycerophosphotransferase
MIGESRLVRRLKDSRAAQPLKQAVRSYRERNIPVLSVVVPMHNAGRFLSRCVDSILVQGGRLQVILVDDGSTDDTRVVAARLAAAHPNVVLVTQAHAGVGAARNRGVQHATGDYLAFCDADDVVPPQGYGRLVDALEQSGSDVAVGAAAIQVKGRFSQPEWARRSNPRRRIGAHVTDVPEILGNLVVGARVFRRASWDAAGLQFESDDERADVRLLVRSLLVSRTIDVVPAVVYRWFARDDNRSLHQRDLYDPLRVADRVRALRIAGELLVDSAEPLTQTYFSEILHTTVPDLVKAAVCRDDGYWGALHQELTRLLELIPSATLDRVPVADRITAWLCAQDERAATEEYLEYAFDNQNGFPFDLSQGRPRIALPFIDALSAAPRGLTLVADADLSFRARLTRVGWLRDGVLGLQGAAFMEYLDDRCGESVIELVLIERGTGREVRRPAEPCEAVAVNQWCSRANEDHTRAGFAVEIDVAGLEVAEPTSFEVHVELRLAGFERVGPFRSRNAAGSAGLLEVSTVDGTAYQPVWHEHRGLTLRVGLPVEPDHVPPPGPVVADTVTASGGVLRLEGASDQDLWVQLVGPRAATTPVQAVREGNRFRVGISLLEDEWGMTPTSLPADTYLVRARTSDGTEVPVSCARSLWRELPARFDADEWTIAPSVVDGRLNVRVVPVEWNSSRPPLLRRAMRDNLYVESREMPLLDAVLFETFAGKGTGDNPGAICAEFARRGLDLDLVFSVIDRSNVPPPGARTVIRWSPEWFELLGRARYLVVNASLPYFFRKREGQLYFQTWHGTPLKRIAHDRPHLDFFNWHHRRQLLVARDGWDYLLSQSRFCTEFLCSAFRYSGPVMEVGYPRNDILVSETGHEVRRRVRAHFGIPEGAKVVLYAPTWRDNSRVGRVFNKVLYLDPLELVSSVEDCYLLVRGHYNSVGAAEDRTGSDRVLDVTRYPDIADLYLAADVLVTDYSSVFFDFAIADKPMVFLAPDLEAYRDENRGFYLDYHETVPGPICLTTAEVVEEISAPDRYAEVRKDFRERFAPLDDGSAAARVVDGILASHPLPGV